VCSSLPGQTFAELAGGGPARFGPGRTANEIDAECPAKLITTTHGAGAEQGGGVKPPRKENGQKSALLCAMLMPNLEQLACSGVFSGAGRSQFCRWAWAGVRPAAADSGLPVEVSAESLRLADIK
jgi:hypothetical protein